MCQEVLIILTLDKPLCVTEKREPNCVRSSVHVSFYVCIECTFSQYDKCFKIYTPLNIRLNMIYALIWNI